MDEEKSIDLGEKGELIERSKDIVSLLL